VGFSSVYRSCILIWFNIYDLFDLMIWFDFFGLQSPQLVEHSCSARVNWDLNKVIIIIIYIIIRFSVYSEVHGLIWQDINQAWG